MGDWQLLSHPDCSLCESMLEQLVALLGERAAAVQVVDISDDAELERKYGQRVPVLLVDGELVCAYRLDEERVKAHLADV